MHLRLAGAIATLIVIIVGFAMISPLFVWNQTVETKPIVMLSFGISETDNAVEWCRDLSIILEKHGIAATVFFAGKVAEQYPQTVSCFSQRIDVGSQTFSNVDLTSMSDYTLKLQEVQQGKLAVDNAGHLESKIFRAPYRSTDQDIYSLLSRSNITADFSYSTQYNIYQHGKFVKVDAEVYDGANFSPEALVGLSKVSVPILINFDAPYPVSRIDYFLSNVDKVHFEFLNASELGGYSLTLRGI